MSDAPPDIGEENWGDELNAYLASLEDADRRSLEAAQPEYIYNSYAWQFSSAAPPATGSQLRLNNVDPTLATLIDVRKIDSDGADRTPVFQQLDHGLDGSAINDWDNAAILHRYNVIWHTDDGRHQRSDPGDLGVG